jgi:pyruvate kinase
VIALLFTLGLAGASVHADSYDDRRVRTAARLMRALLTAHESLDTRRNAARLNFSHDTHAEHRKRLGVVREAAAALGANVAIMLDTKGVKIRTGRVEGGVARLATGDRFTLYTDGRTGDARGTSVSYTDLPEEVVPGSKILIDDGVIELEVESVGGDAIECLITRGGNLADRKGVNLPGTSLGIPAMTPENRADIVFAGGPGCQGRSVPPDVPADG